MPPAKLRSIFVALVVLAAFLVVAPPPQGQAQTRPQAQAPNIYWSDAYPASGDVTIPKGQTVVLDHDVDLSSLVIDGILRCGSGPIDLRSESIVVNGIFNCGTTKSRHKGAFTVTLTGNGNAVSDKALIVNTGGAFVFHGLERTSWVRLTKTATAGSNKLHLENTDWKVGDKIVIAPTDFNPAQAEDATIIARSGNVVTLDHPLDYTHFCGSETYGTETVTECAEVGLLTRSLTIRGDAESEDSMVGGHAMFHTGTRVQIDGVSFYRMGQVGEAGRYPIHFHHYGDGSISYVKSTSIWRSYNRWITLHGAQNMRIENNVGYDTLGHGFYLEDGDEIGNSITGNLGVLAKAGIDGQLVTPSDNDAATFWIANPDNKIVGNVAAGADHSGFWYSLPERPLGPTANEEIYPRETPLDVFDDNVAHSVGFAGLMIDLGEKPDRTLETVWYNPREVPGDSNSALVEPVFTNFTTYKSRHYGMWVRTFSGGTFSDMTFADNWRSVYLANIESGPTWDNVATIEDSLLVGETANVGQPEVWEDTGLDGRSLPKFWDPSSALGGVPFYDGPMEVRDTVFANFVGNSQRDAGALTNLFPNAFWVSPENGVWDATFVNAQRVLLPDAEEYVDGDTTTVFNDETGSVTGVAGATVTIADALVDNASCTPRPEWNAMQCDPSVGHMSVTIHRLDGKWARLKLDRDDGRSYGFDGSGDQNTTVFIMLIAEMEHELTWEAGTPAQFNMYVPGTSQMDGRAARLVMPAPGGSWDFQVNGQTTSAPNLAALNSGPSNWYYDAATNMIHLRLAGDQNWVTMG